MSENGEPVGREGRAKLLAGRISCAVGVIFAVVGVVDAIAGGRASISAGALGAALGILGYFLDANQLGTATVVLSIAALFFGLAASQGYIPGIEASDRGLPTVEPGSGNGPGSVTESHPAHAAEMLARKLGPARPDRTARGNTVAEVHGLRRAPCGTADAIRCREAGTLPLYWLTGCRE